MDAGDSNFNKAGNPFVSEQQVEGNDNVSLETGAESPPPSTTFNDMKLPSPRKGRKPIQKRVVSVPIKDVDSSRLKGESAPPSDSWAWRKYGQKPIKGSPYPRSNFQSLIKISVFILRRTEVITGVVAQRDVQQGNKLRGA
ncbi:hypothetical protein Gotri_006123, partial [Gossypium trilobum]|nr:hypothetical protein [Gossypium trilobum]